MTCLRCQHGTANRFGTYGKLRIQRFRCTTCRATFTAPRKKPLGRHYTDAAKATQIVTLLMEGMSVRAVSRITGMHLKAAVDLYMAFFNLCRVHQTLRVTPAMQAGITDHIWTVQELVTWTA